MRARLAELRVIFHIATIEVVGRHEEQEQDADEQLRITSSQVSRRVRKRVGEGRLEPCEFEGRTPIGVSVMTRNLM